jgi:hypothetical protein
LLLYSGDVAMATVGTGGGTEGMGGGMEGMGGGDGDGARGGGGGGEAMGTVRAPGTVARGLEAVEVVVALALRGVRLATEALLPAKYQANCQVSEKRHVQFWVPDTHRLSYR